MPPSGLRVSSRLSFYAVTRYFATGLHIERRSRKTLQGGSNETRFGAGAFLIRAGRQAKGSICANVRSQLPAALKRKSSFAVLASRTEVAPVMVPDKPV